MFGEAFYEKHAPAFTPSWVKTVAVPRRETPKGQYGGGTVMVWDIGTYDLIESNYYKGMLRVYLNGTKLKGEWTLQRFANGKDDRDRDKWYLLTKRTMAQIASNADAVWQSSR